MDAILVPGGFGKRGVEGKIAAVRHAREHGIPYLGICLGMQLAVIECARHMAGLANANSTEFDPDTPHPVVALITEWQNRDGSIEKRTRDIRPGRHDAPGRAALRSGAGYARAPDLRRDDASPSATGIATRSTTTTCRASRRRGSRSAPGRRATTAGDLSRWSSCRSHPWFFGCQFHPEFTSNPRRGHPLFVSFVQRRARRAAQRAPGDAGRRRSPSWSPRADVAHEALRLRRRPRRGRSS